MCSWSRRSPYHRVPHTLSRRAFQVCGSLCLCAVRVAQHLDSPSVTTCYFTVPHAQACVTMGSSAPPFLLAARPLLFMYGDSITQLGSKVLALWISRRVYAIGRAHERVGDDGCSKCLRCRGHSARMQTEHSGWVLKLQEAYSARRVADVLNRGYSGYNTRCEMGGACRESLQDPGSD